jgi:hypothetical protein
MAYPWVSVSSSEHGDGVDVLPRVALIVVVDAMGWLRRGGTVC